MLYFEDAILWKKTNVLYQMVRVALFSVQILTDFELF
jgi:hypothetical protein